MRSALWFGGRGDGFISATPVAGTKQVANVEYNLTEVNGFTFDKF